MEAVEEEKVAAVEMAVEVEIDMMTEIIMEVADGTHSQATGDLMASQVRKLLLILCQFQFK